MWIRSLAFGNATVPSTDGSIISPLTVVFRPRPAWFLHLRHRRLRRSSPRGRRAEKRDWGPYMPSAASRRQSMTTI